MVEIQLVVAPQATGAKCHMWEQPSHDGIVGECVRHERTRGQDVLLDQQTHRVRPSGLRIAGACHMPFRSKTPVHHVPVTAIAIPSNR